MMTVALLSVIVVPPLFLYAIPGAIEYWWDKAALAILYLLLLCLTFVKRVSPSFYHLAYFYTGVLYTLVTIVNFSINNFRVSYFLALILIIFTLGVTIKKRSNAIIYVIISVTSSVLAVAIIHDGTEKVQMISWLLVFGAMTYFLLVSKSDVLKNLKARREILRTVVSKTEEAILITDMKGFVIDFNPRAVELFGYSEKELEVVDFNTFRQEEISDEETEEGIELLRQDKFWKDEVPLKRKDGSEFIGFVSITLVNFNDVEYLVIRIMDITKNKMAEQELIKAKEEAEMATKAKSLFLASMSHEIRTPMNGVIGMSDMLMRSNLDDEQLVQVRTIKRSGENLMVILNDILDFSKIESGKMLIEAHEFDLREALDELHGLFSHQAQEKGIDLKFEVDEKIPNRISADSNRLRQVILNLLSNSIKFTENGVVNLKVKKHNGSNGQCQLFFEVSDTGIGIPHEKRAHLFDAFTQVDSSTTRKYGGTGLGLSISKRLVELMGGKIEVKSRLGEGSTFTFDIKCKVVQDLNVEEEKEVVSKTFNREKMKGLKVLVAEDNKVNQQVIRMMLESVDVDVTIVETGLEAISATKEKDFDLIFMDVQMPEMDGLEATEAILGEVDPNAYIVAMTANVLSEDRDRCLEAGMVGFLGKPVLNDTLLKRLDEFVSRKSKYQKAS
ncbi:PAS domain-containing hybrid sensor histidine kinase/response regulator [Halocola ammonii]